MKKLILIIIFCIYSTVGVSKTLTFGVVPQQSASRLAEQWAPLISYLSTQLGQEIVFATTPDIPSFEEKLERGEFDIAYMNPYHYTVYSQQPGYRAAAKAKDKLIKGIIVVRKDSGVTEMGQLQHEKLAFPSPAAFAKTFSHSRTSNKQISILHQPMCRLTIQFICLLLKAFSCWWRYFTYL